MLFSYQPVANFCFSHGCSEVDELLRKWLLVEKYPWVIVFVVEGSFHIPIQYLHCQHTKLAI